MYLNPYRDVEQYLGSQQASSLTAFRIANIGLPANFGPSAGMFRYYNVAADYNTFIPHELVREVQTDQLHATMLPAYFDTNPQAFASKPWERLAIRYYLIGADTFASLPRAALAKPGLHVVSTQSYWKVVEDDLAAPFVASVDRSGRQAPIAASMMRDSFAFAVPSDVDVVRFAQNYDSWWHAYDDQGVDRSTLLYDDEGQLALSAQSLAGRRVVVSYTDRATTIALALTIIVQLVLGVAYVALRIVRWRRGPTAATAA
jgi:hypothetical protein